MEEQTAQTAPSNSSQNLRKVLFGAVILLFIVAVFSMVSIMNRSSISPVSDEQQSQMTGYIYFNDDEEETKRSLLKRYNLGNGQIETVLDDPEHYVTTFTPVGSGAAFLSAPFDSESSYPFPYTEYKKMMVVGAEGETLSRFGTYDISLIRNITWSPATERFAFSGASREVTTKEIAGEPVDYNTMSNFSLYVEQGEVLKEIPGGVSPEWSADGTVVYYLSSNGLYQYEPESEQTEQVLTRLESDISRWSTFVFTFDRTHIVMGTPRFHVLHVYEVMSEHPLELRSVGFVETEHGVPPYDVFSVGQEDTIGYVWYDEEGVATVTVYDVSENDFTDLFSVSTHNEFPLEPAWSEHAVNI